MTANTTTGKKPRGRPLEVPRPFLKWVGGKGQLVDRLRQLVPQSFGRYHEPFAGGAALFFALRPRGASLCDLNEELIHCYKIVRDHVDELICELKTHVYEKAHYYEMRNTPPHQLAPIAQAARTIYLNKSGFNGLYRVNSKGLFNVPFGRHTRPTICDEKNLRACSAALSGVELACRSFEHVLESADCGDFVYFDPPYIPLSRTANFTAYARNGFDMAGQQRLAQVFDALAERGVYVMLSNADVPWIHKRYARHNIRIITARRHVNRDSSGRGAINEVIITSY